jgi:hypothetical protein
VFGVIGYWKDAIMIRRQGKWSAVLQRFLLIGPPLILFLALLAVSGEASDESSDSCLNVAGTWRVESIIDVTDCGEGQHSDPGTAAFKVTQKECTILVLNESIIFYHGTANGNKIDLDGRYAEDGGTTEESADLTIEGNTLSGTSSWIWSGPGGTCSGTTQISGTLEYAPPPPEVTTLDGMVRDATSGQPVGRALISLSPGGHQVSSGTDGSFSASSLPPGTYMVHVSASSYFTKTLQDVTLLGAVSNQLNVSLVPYSPQVLDPSAAPPTVGNDGQGATLLSVHVTHPLGLSSITSVFGDLSPIGGSAQQAFYDDGNHGDGGAGDGTYGSFATVAQGVKARLYALNVTAVDSAGKKGFGSISLNVTERVTGIVGPSQSGSEIFDNTLGGQALNINIRFSSSQTVSGLRAIRGECQAVVTIYDPSGLIYGTFSVADATDINIPIPGAAAGQWEYEIVSQCDSALSYEVETSGSGTGMLVGRVVDGFSGSGVTGANINSNTGGTTVSLDQGYFSGVAVAGTGQVITSKVGYQTNIKNGVHVKAGAATNLSIQIVPQDAPAQAVPSGQNIYQILDPSADPNLPAQPFAAKVSGSNLEFNVLFPRYLQAVDLYLGFTINAPQHAGKLYLFDQNDAVVELTGTLPPWRKGTTNNESAQVLISAISGIYPLADYTLYALVTTDSTLSHYDLTYFTTTLAKPPPEGRNVTPISNPLDDPNPMTQPLAAKVTGGNLILNAHFPLQAQPVTVYLGYSTPSGELFLFRQDHSLELLTETLWPWRQNVTAEQAAQILSTPTAQISQGAYYFYALVTTDPVSFSNFDLTYFALRIGE